MRKSSLEALWARLATRLATPAAVLLQILVLLLALVTIVEAAMQIRNYFDGIVRADRLLMIGGWVAAGIPAVCTIYWGGRAILSQGRWLRPGHKDTA